MKTLQDYIDKLKALNFKEMYEGDFFLTWEKTDDEIAGVFAVAALAFPIVLLPGWRSRLAAAALAALVGWGLWQAAGHINPRFKDGDSCESGFFALHQLVAKFVAAHDHTPMCALCCTWSCSARWARLLSRCCW